VNQTKLVTYKLDKNNTFKKKDIIIFDEITSEPPKTIKYAII
jgi:predicted AAA+ superfamily ATPase